MRTLKDKLLEITQNCTTLTGKGRDRGYADGYSWGYDMGWGDAASGQEKNLSGGITSEVDDILIPSSIASVQEKLEAIQHNCQSLWNRGYNDGHYDGYASAYNLGYDDFFKANPNNIYLSAWRDYNPIYERKEMDRPNEFKLTYNIIDTIHTWFTAPCKIDYYSYRYSDSPYVYTCTITSSQIQQLAAGDVVSIAFYEQGAVAAHTHTLTQTEVNQGWFYLSEETWTPPLKNSLLAEISDWCNDTNDTYDSWLCFDQHTTEWKVEATLEQTYQSGGYLDLEATENIWSFEPITSTFWVTSWGDSYNFWAPWQAQVPTDSAAYRIFDACISNGIYPEETFALPAYDIVECGSQYKITMPFPDISYSSSQNIYLCTLNNDTSKSTIDITDLYPSIKNKTITDSSIEGDTQWAHLFNYNFSQIVFDCLLSHQLWTVTQDQELLWLEIRNS